MQLISRYLKACILYVEIRRQQSLCQSQGVQDQPFVFFSSIFLLRPAGPPPLRLRTTPAYQRCFYLLVCTSRVMLPGFWFHCGWHLDVDYSLLENAACHAHLYPRGFKCTVVHEAPNSGGIVNRVCWSRDLIMQFCVSCLPSVAAVTDYSV